jgi:two-component system nitrogen regulation response regulator GlnG
VLDSALRLGRDILLPAVYEKPEEDRSIARIIGQSPAMKEVYKLIGLIAPRDINVLITGESGTGKELVARAILHHSPRRDRPFLAVNCAAIPETLLESELFGHEKGAFTGADMRRIGKFEQCSGGTLLLDEIGDIPLPTQAKLLRVLQDGSFQRLGGTQTIRCSVRILAATHQPLEELIARRQFRQDLYYRLKVASIHVPALREREVDVVLLAHHFVNDCNRQLGTKVRRFAPETLPLLLNYSWPGNVRELENTIKSALVVARGSVLRPESLPMVLRQAGPSAATAARAGMDAPANGAPHEDTRLLANRGGRALRETVAGLLAGTHHTGQLYRQAMELMERAVIRAAVERTRGNMAGAARLLGISRTTLRVKMEQFELNATVKVRPKMDAPAHVNRQTA